MTERSTHDLVLMWMAAAVAVFLTISVIGAIVLAIVGENPTGVWSEVFNLVNVMAGALVGYITGSYVSAKDFYNRPGETYGMKDVKDEEETGHA